MGASIPLALRADSVLDTRRRPLADLRISVIDQCNFRCPYCMPADAYPQHFPFLKSDQRLSFDEIERLARVFVRLGVRKLRLTGGEPLLRRDLPDLVRRLAAIPEIEDIAMTTNGVLLPRHAQALRDAGLQRVTLSLDSLDAPTFARLSGGRGQLDQVLAGLAAAEAAGFAPIKINCVVMRGINDHEVLAMVERFRGTPHIVRFIEFMDVGTLNAWRETSVVPSAELRQRIAARWPLQALPSRRAGEVATRFAFVDGGGEIGFISSISAPFCGDCSRARLAADGQLFTCLFAAHGHDLRALLRGGGDDVALQQSIAALWSRRDDHYSEERARARASGASEHVEMFHIGG